MTNENSMGELYAALAAARLEFTKLSKSKTVNTGTYSYSYAELSDVIEATAPALAKHGLVIIQDPEVVQENGKSTVVVHGCIAHKSGAVHQLHPLVMPAGDGKAQAIGSAISYGRRYQAQAALNLAAEDDDGTAAQTPQQPQERAQGRTTPNHTAQPRQAQQRHATQPTANVDDAPEVDPDGLQTIEGTPPHQRFFGTGLSIFGPDWDAGARAWLIERWTAKQTPKSVRTSSTRLSDDEKDMLADYMNEHVSELQRVWKNVKPNRVMKEAA